MTPLNKTAAIKAAARSQAAWRRAQRLSLRGNFQPRLIQPPDLPGGRGGRETGEQKDRSLLLISRALADMPSKYLEML